MDRKFFQKKWKKRFYFQDSVKILILNNIRWYNDDNFETGWNRE